MQTDKNKNEIIYVEIIDYLLRMGQNIDDLLWRKYRKRGGEYMRRSRNWSKRLLAGMLSAAMVALNVSTATSAFASPSAEEYREDAELINDLGRSQSEQRDIQKRGTASPSDATEAEKTGQASNILVGSSRWGTPSNAAKLLYTRLDGVEIEVSAPTGVLPEGASLKARKLTEEEEKEVLAKINAHAEAAGKSATAQFLCDLTVLNAAGEEIQPDNTKGTLAVSFRNVTIVSAVSAETGAGDQELEKSGVSVLHIDEEGEKVDTLREGLNENLPVLQAAAKHFSPFAVVNYTPTSATPLPLSVAFKRLDYDNDSRLAYKLKDVTVTDTPGTGITSMNFQVDTGSIELLSTPTGVQTFTDILSAHKFYQIIFPTALTPADAQTFIENNLKFHLPSAGATQQVKITLGNGANNLPTGATITKANIPNPVAGDGAEHYYMYVEPVANTEISWAESYNLAKSYKLNGMQGYLATITSQSEDRTLDNITMKGAWSGGARLEGVNDASSVPNWYDNSTAGVTGVFSNLLQHGNTAGGSWHQWRWQDGPETNTEFYEANGRGAINGAYTNWGPGQPDSANMPGTSYKEGFMQVHHGTGTWNDLPNLNNWHPAIYVFGFFVEFSSYNQNATTTDQSIPLVTSDVAYAEVGGQKHYFSNLDDAIAWSSRNGNPAVTLTNNTVVTQNIPAGVVINTNGKTLGVPAGSNVTNNGTINVTGGSAFLVQGSNGGFTNAGNGAVNVPLTIKVNPRTVTATETLTWNPSDVTVTGLIGNDRVTGVTVNFDNSQPVATTTTDNATPLAPTTLDNGTAGSTAIGTYTISYVPGPVTRNPHHYTVKFVANAPAGQTATGTMADQTIIGNAAANLTNGFAVNGCRFVNWSASNGRTYADGDMPTLLATQNGAVVTMTANWDAIRYNVQYTDNVDTTSMTAVLSDNPNYMTSYYVWDPDVALLPMTWTGYNFEGWYDNPAFTGSPVTTLYTKAAPAGDRHYYAKWSTKTYNLSYHLNDSVTQPAYNQDWGFTSYTVEDAVYPFFGAIRPGYNFLGWFTDAALTTPAPATLDPTEADTNPTDLYAKWSAPLPYSITYVLNDTTPAGHPASNPAANPGGFDVTNPAITLQAPTRRGYTFLGWYWNESFTVPIPTIDPARAEDYMVYAKWSAPNAYTVQWTLNDTVPAGLTAANPNASLTSYTVEDADYTLRPATRTGYTFENWYDNAALTGTPVTTLHTMDAEDKHYYAKWGNALSYPITYVMNDSATSPASAVTPNSYTVEDADFALGIPTRNGATFLGWYDNAALSGAAITTLHTADAAAKTYYAKWQLTSYTINYNLNPGTGIGTPTNPASNVPSFTVEDDVPLTPPVRRGYTGSWTMNGQTVTSIPAGTTGNQTITASWTLNHYNITYDTGETANSPIQGLGSLPSTYTIEDATITLPTPSRVGYTFSHWEKVTAPGVADNQILSGSDGDVAFKAVWEPIRYRITYDTAGGVNDAANPTTFTIEDEINPNGAVKQGVKFWTWQVVGGKFLNTIPAGTTHDVALVAVYQKDSEGENIGGSGGSSGGGGGGGSRSSSGRRGTVTPNNVATGIPTGTQPSNTQPNTTPNTGEDKKPVIEPTPQQNADTLNRGNALSQDGGKRATNRGTAVSSNKGRLPKTGEAPFALNFAGTAAGFLLAAYAVLGRRRKEQ